MENSRVIEFRAWDKVNKKWLFTKSGGQSLQTNGKLEYTYKDIFCLLDWEILTVIGAFPANYEIMQYTGLLDKNERKIFEGDMVKCKFSFGDNICEIIEENGCYWVSQKNREIQDKAHDNLYWHVEGIEVIGNIYEHKHLIDNTDTKV